MFLQQFLPQLLTKRVSTECAVFRRFCFARAELSHSAGIRRTPNASRLSLSVCLFVTNAFRKIIAKMTDFHLYYSARRRIFEIVARRAEDRRGLPAVTEKL